MRKIKTKKLSKKLRFSPVKTRVNEDRSVSCKYVCDLVIPSTHTITKEIVTGIGKAYCNPDDKMDEHKGFALADSRAKLNAYQNMLAKLADVYNVCCFDSLMIVANKMKEEAKRLNDDADFINKMAYLTKAEKKHINWLLFHK